MLHKIEYQIDWHKINKFPTRCQLFNRDIEDFSKVENQIGRWHYCGGHNGHFMFGDSTIQPILDGNFKSHTEWLYEYGWEWSGCNPNSAVGMQREGWAIDCDISQHTFYCDNTNMSDDALHVFISISINIFGEDKQIIKIWKTSDVINHSSTLSLPPYQGS